MKKLLLTSLTILTTIVTFAQSQGPNNPGTAVGVPNQSCLGCPGADFNTIPNVYLQDNAVAYVALQPNANCFQSNCYYSRFLYASNFGFTVPGTATITGVVAEIYRMSGNTNSAADSSVRLVKASVPQGANRAISTPWPLTAAYYTYGSPSDMWGLTWAPTEINSYSFGLYLRVFNMSSQPTTPTVDHIRITVYYSTTTGTFSQTSTPSTLNAYQNENELEVAFIINEAITKGSVRIFNVLGEMKAGREVFNLPAGLNTEKFAIGNLAAGVYFVQFDNGTSIQTKKVFIQY